MGEGFIIRLDQNGDYVGDNIAVHKTNYPRFVEFELLNGDSFILKAQDVFYYSDEELEAWSGTYKAIKVSNKKIEAIKVK